MKGLVDNRMTRVTNNTVCIVRRNGPNKYEYIRVFQTTDMNLAMMVANSCKEFNENVVICGDGVGFDFHGEIDV